MEIDATLELIQICQDILNRRLSLEEWSKIESSDMFQTNQFNGGFDATENAFCFSYYDLQDKEFWFQISLEEVNQIITGEKKKICLAEVE